MTTTEAFPVPHSGVRERGTGTNDHRVERGRGLYVDVAALLKDGLPDPPQPAVLHRDDGHAIFYRGQVNALFGEPESGKTLIAKAAASEDAKAGRKVMFIDIDHNGPEATIGHLVALGVPVDYLSDPDRFRYYEPEDRAELVDLVAFLKVWRPALVVVDSVGELLPLFGANSNSPDDFTSVHTTVLKPIAAAGAAVVVIDHLAKNTDSKAAGPTGTAAKRRAIGGVSVRVKVNEQFVPGYGGSAWLTVNKDRHGGLRQHCPRGDREPSAGLFTLITDGDRLRWTLKSPTENDATAISGVPLADLAELDKLDPLPQSVKDVKDRMHWRSERAADALREWRRSRSPGTDGERGTNWEEGVPGSPPPMSGTGNAPGEPPPERSPRSTCLVCQEPMFETGEGHTTHPNCGPPKPCGHPGKATANGRCGTCIADRLAAERRAS